jgi:hypothetical protein
LVQRNILFAVARIDSVRGLGREAEQRPDRAVGFAARAQLQHLAEQPV